MGSFIYNNLKTSVFFSVPRIANTSEVRQSGDSNRMADTLESKENTGNERLVIREVKNISFKNGASGKR